MRACNLVFITLLALCHLPLQGQALTEGLPPASQKSSPQKPGDETQPLPDDPGLEALPVARPEPEPPTGRPVDWRADRQTYANDVWTLYGVDEFHYRDYTLSADKVVYNQKTSELEAEGHVQVAGGPEDVLINADHGDMRLDMHTARFFHVTGTIGVRRSGRAIVYSSPNPFEFSGRVLLQTGDGNYRMVDGSMTNCNLPKPDWALISRSIRLANEKASASNTWFKALGIPLFYIPYVRHPVDETGRESGLLIPVISTSSIKGFIVGEQIYWVINRSMDMVVGSEYYSKRGWAPNGDFRYKGPGFDRLQVRWNALLDRGVEETQYPVPAVGTSADQPVDRSGAFQPADRPAGPTEAIANQGGVDVAAVGRKDIKPGTYIAGNVEYLSSYIYRLVFNDNYSQAISSEVSSDLSLTHERDGRVPSISLDRFQTFASSTVGDEARILHLPNLRYDVLDRPLADSPVYWGLGSSLDHLSRSEPGFHAHNVGRFDIYPHISLPIEFDGWSIVPQAAVRDTFYSGSQNPDLTGANGGIPTVSHDALNRSDVEASLDLRPPAVERDFTLSRWNRELRHVIEPELTYSYVGGIGAQERNVLLVDTTDIATNTNELGYSLTQRFYVRPESAAPCLADATVAGECPARPREWASWQIAQKFFIDPNFGGALIPNRSNVFDSTLDLSAVAFLTSPRNLSPIISRMRFEAIDNLRIQWDLDYDPKAGRLGSDNLFAGYSWGRTTVGLGHSLLNAVDETGSYASITKSQIVQPFVYIGKSTGAGFNLAANGGYDFVQNALQYAGVQAVYNWGCCGISLGYRRFALGSIRDETQYLYSITLASFGSVGDIRSANSIFRNPNVPPPY
jgi:LPS-assembly protein